MFPIGDTFWFVLKGRDNKEHRIKGKILEENNYMVKILTDKGTEEIIPLIRILDTNKERIEYPNE